MTRLYQKCLLASTGAHALLALLLIIAPLIWVSQRHQLPISGPTLTIMPTRLVDGATSGGGSPTAKGEPAPAQVAEPAPPAPPPKVEEAPKPEVKQAVREEAKAPAKPETSTKGKPVASKEPTKPQAKEEAAPAKRKIELSFARDTGSTSRRSNAEARRRAEAAQAAGAQYASTVKSVVGAIGAGMSSGTSIEAFGPGGEATANYGQWVEFFYRQKWSQPAETADKRAAVKAKVVIRRDGTVDTFKIIQPSGNATLDASVDRLKNLRFVAPFPEGATDTFRTFIINFNLKEEL
ncbi:MAG: TonB family protein [Verrucomicrobiia bacterium]